MSVKHHSIYFTLVFLLFAGNTFARSLSPDGTELYFISPQDGQTVTSPVSVQFGLKGMGIAPAGIKKDGTGHHHLLIDLTELPVLDRPLPSDAHHKHFGGGQTETTLELEPGEHTLQLLLGDENHIPHDPVVVSDKIRITVK